MILHGSVASKVLGMQTGLTVYTPDKLSEKGSYRIVYLLHGLHGNNQTWLNNTMLTQYTTDLNAIFVMPEVGRSFYADMVHGYDFKMYIGSELPEIVKNVFNISSRREDTAIIGCSMGGHGALKLALSMPGQYGFCGAISPACLYINEYLTRLQDEGSSWAAMSPVNAAILRDFYAIFGDNLALSCDNDIGYLANACANLKKAKTPKIYACCGLADSLLEENRRFHHDVEDSALDYTFDEWDGDHDWKFFNEALQKALALWG